MSKLVKGKHVDEAMAIKSVTIVNELHLPLVKIHCSVLAGNAIQAAISDWHKHLAGSAAADTLNQEKTAEV